MTLAAHGEFYPISSHTEAPYQPAALPDYDPSMSSAMAQVFVSSYVLETAGYVYWKANALSGTYARISACSISKTWHAVLLTASMVPPQSPIQLNTSSFASMNSTQAVNFLLIFSVIFCSYCACFV